MVRYTDLIKCQERIAKKISLRDGFSDIKTVGGFDIAYLEKKAICCGVVIDYKSLKAKEIITQKTKISFPYVPTFLSFREGPAVIKIYKRLKVKPDVLMVNGHGIAHPRNAGLASYIGVLLDKPAIGIATNKLIGEYEKPKKPGQATKLIFDKKQVGWVLKTKEGCKPIFISPGHKISLSSTLDITLKCLKFGKLPEPIRLAHFYANNTQN